MTAIRESIFVEVEQRLRAIPYIQEVERMPSGDAARFPALHIFDGGNDIAESDWGTTRYTLSLTVEGYVERASGPAAHDALHTLYADTVAALISEPPLGGLAETINEGGMRVEVAELASKRRLGFALDFIISFPTRRGDPAQSA